MGSPWGHVTQVAVKTLSQWDEYSVLRNGRKSILMHSLVQRATRTLKAIVWKCYGIDCFLVQLARIPESRPRKRCTQSCAREIIDNCANKKSLFTYLFNAYDTGGAIELEQSSILTLWRFHPKVTREKCSYKEGCFWNLLNWNVPCWLAPN